MPKRLLIRHMKLESILRQNLFELKLMIEIITIPDGNIIIGKSKEYV